MANPSVPAETRTVPFYPPAFNKCHSNQKHFSLGIGGQFLPRSESLRQCGVRDTGDFCGQILRIGNIL